MHQRFTPAFIGDGRFLSTHAVEIYCKESLPVNPVMLQGKKKKIKPQSPSKLSGSLSYQWQSREGLNTQWASIWKHGPEEL